MPSALSNGIASPQMPRSEVAHLVEFHAGEQPAADSLDREVMNGDGSGEPGSPSDDDPDADASPQHTAEVVMVADADSVGEAQPSGGDASDADDAAGMDYDAAGAAAPDAMQTDDGSGDEDVAQQLSSDSDDDVPLGQRPTNQTAHSSGAAEPRNSASTDAAAASDDDSDGLRPQSKDSAKSSSRPGSAGGGGSSLDRPGSGKTKVYTMPKIKR